MVLAYQRFQAFRETYETAGQRALFQHFSDLVFGREFFASQPHALSHKERIVLDFFLCLYLVAFQKLVYDHVHHSVELFEEEFDVAL